jgi:hypothetical protein
MSRSPVLTDSLIRTALTPAAYVDAPSDLLAAVAAEVRRTPQRRPLLRWPWNSDLGAPFRPVPSHRLLWALVALGLLLALVVGTLGGAGYLRRAPAIPPPAIPLSGTGIDTLPPDAAGYGDVLVDGAGTLWATGPGHVTRFDPDTGQRRTWTVSDDLSFNASIVAPASAGGLWLWSGQTIRRFDGTAMREQIPAPVGGTDPAALVEGPTGSIWASSSSGGPWRWDGSAWLATPDGGPPYGAWPLLVVADDDLWVGNLSYPGPTFLGASHLAGDHWVTFDDGAAALSGQFAFLEEGQDGSVWVGSDLGIARYAGGSWTPVEGPGFGVVDLAIDGDGVAWALSGETPARVARLGGGTWTTYGPESGFPGEVALGISATAAGVFLGTSGGLYRFADERWTLAWPESGAGPSTAGSAEILAVSEGEAWVAVDGQGLWHFAGGAWIGPEAAELSIHAFALRSDGALFVAGSGGVTVRRDGRWSTAWTGNPMTGNATSVAIAPNGSVWITASGELVELREIDGGWSSRSIRCPAGGQGVVVTADGAVWTGGFAYTGTSGLARIDGDSCIEVWPLGDARTHGIGGLAAGPAGGLAAVVDEDGPSELRSVVWFDGTAWSTLLTGQAPGGGALAVGPGGEVWFSGRWPEHAMKRYDNGAWHDVAAGIWAGQISVAPDGTVWFLGPSGIQRIRAVATN